MDISKVINDVVNQVSLQTETGMVDLNDAYHSHLVKEEMKKYLDEATVEQFFSSQIINEKSDKDREAFKKQHKFLNQTQAEKFYDILGNKTNDFSLFIKNLPKGDPLKKAQTSLNSFSEKEIKEFKNFLWSTNEPKAGGLPRGGAAGKLFDLKPDGAGRGEVYLAALCKNSFIQGGSESFDLQSSTTKYEVKDYSTSGTSIRAGVEASVSKFNFWKQILKTIDAIKSVNKQNGWDLIPDSTEKTELIKVKDYIINRVEKQMKIVTGEYNKTDQKYMLDFYALANKLLTIKDTSFSQAVFRGANQKPISLSIAPLEPSDISGKNTITIEVINTKADIGQLVNYLNRLTYVRDPNVFTADIAEAMRSIIEDGPAQKWIIFRKTGMKVIDAKGSNFQYEQISQNGVKFKEV